MAAADYSNFRIILECLPVSLEVLEGCTFADSIKIGACCLDEWKAVIGNFTGQEKGPGFHPILAG